MTELWNRRGATFFGPSREERAAPENSKAGSSPRTPKVANSAARRDISSVTCQVEDLIAAGVPPTDVPVITPYAAQARLLRDRIDSPGVEVDSVDGFLGCEKEAVVISLVRSNTKGELAILTDTRRMNVALTRARRKLIVFGDSSTLANHEFYLRLLEFFKREDVYGTVWEI